MVFKRAAARRDLVAHFVYLAENAGMATADRFLVNAEATFSELSEQPSMGALVSARSNKLAKVRKWRVREFENFLIFYLPGRQGVSVVRVLYAAEDWWRLLGVEPAKPAVPNAKTRAAMAEVDETLKSRRGRFTSAAKLFDDLGKKHK